MQSAAHCCVDLYMNSWSRNEGAAQNIIPPPPQPTPPLLPSPEPCYIVDGSSFKRAPPIIYKQLLHVTSEKTKPTHPTDRHTRKKKKKKSEENIRAHASLGLPCTWRQ